VTTPQRNCNHHILIALLRQVSISDFYLLFGHLATENLPKVGDKIKAGEQIGFVGDFDQNGDWFWHLHFQAMSQEGIDKELIYEALFSKDEMALASRISPSVMPIINKML
jgi:murein DD-endopeptidase MepM/ murein hydrolase activator NlpD